MSTPFRALVQLPERIARGEIVTVRLMAAHPMETGHRADGAGGTLPRDIVQRVEVALDGAPVFAADLHPAIAANPFIAFTLRAERSGTLSVRWRGDRGLDHLETLPWRLQA
jgi:sulfur-oxidizing protein SoxZ